VNNSLATAYFETKQYIKAVEKGRDCFKFKPTKSQVPLLSEILYIYKIIIVEYLQDTAYAPKTGANWHLVPSSGRGMPALYNPGQKPFNTLHL